MKNLAILFLFILTGCSSCITTIDGKPYWNVPWLKNSPEYLKSEDYRKTQEREKKRNNKESITINNELHLQTKLSEKVGTNDVYLIMEETCSQSLCQGVGKIFAEYLYIFQSHKLQDERCGECQNKFKVLGNCDNKGCRIIEYKPSVGVSKCDNCKQVAIEAKEHWKKFPCMSYTRDRISYDDTFNIFAFYKRKGFEEFNYENKIKHGGYQIFVYQLCDEEMCIIGKKYSSNSREEKKDYFKAILLGKVNNIPCYIKIDE